MEEHNLKAMEENCLVHVKIAKGMHDLPQAGKITNNLLQKRLKMAGCRPAQFAKGFWMHVWCPVTFAPLVDHFGIKIKGEQHASHSKKSPERHFDVTLCWKGENTQA